MGYGPDPKDDVQPPPWRDFTKDQKFEMMYGPGKFSPCCEPEDLKWYDSGFTRFQYCTKCNKEIKCTS